MDSVLELLKSEYLRRISKGEQYLLQGDGAQAEKAFRDALELFPDQPTAWTKLGLAQYLQKHFEEAQSTLKVAVERLISLGSDPGLALLYEIKALLALGQKAKAKKRGKLLDQRQTKALFRDSAFKLRIQKALRALK